MLDNDPSVSPHSEKKEIPDEIWRSADGVYRWRINDPAVTISSPPTVDNRGGVDWVLTSTPSNVTITPATVRPSSEATITFGSGGTATTNGITFTTTPTETGTARLTFTNSGNVWVRND